MATKNLEEPLLDSGYLSQPLDSSSSLDHTPHEKNSSHLKTSSISSSGYYSRLDSTDFDPIPEETEYPWQHYVTPTDSDHTPLHKSVLDKDLLLLRKIINLLPHPSVVNVQSDVGRETALHLAVKGNLGDFVRVLVVGGADVGVVDFNGENPIHIACRYGFGECLEAMVRAVSIEESGRKGDSNVARALVARDFEGFTPLHLATLSHPTTTPTSPTPLHTLLFLGTQPSCQDLKAGRTPLHLSIETRNYAALTLLLDYATPSDLEIENYSGMTPYTVASCNLLKDFCVALVSKGCDVVDYFSDSSEEEEE